MKKKFLCAVLSIVCIFTLVSAAFAAESGASSNRVIYKGVDITVDVEEEIFRAMNGITDVEPLETYSLESDGASDNTYKTVRKIGDIAGDGSCVYATTTVKTSERIDNMDYVTAHGVIYWVDNLGPSNNLVAVSGGWDVDQRPDGSYPRLSRRYLTVSGGSTATNSKYHKRRLDSDRYSVRIEDMPELSANDFWAYTLYADVYIDDTTFFRFWCST